MANIGIEFSARWAPEDGQCQECPMCTDVIYGKAYRLVVDAGEKTTETPVVICNSCYDAVSE